MSRALARSAKVSLGDRVEVRFSLVDGATVRVPAELAEALRQEPAWRKLWRGLSPGQQRGLAHRIDVARLPETRARRAVEVMRSVEEGKLPLPPRRGLL